MILILALLAMVGAYEYWDNFWVGLLAFSIVGAIAYSGNQSSLHQTINNEGGK